MVQTHTIDLPKFGNRLLLWLGLLLACQVAASAQADVESIAEIRKQFFSIHDLLERQKSEGEIDETAVQEQTIRLLTQLLAEGQPAEQGQAINMAVDFANRLQNRQSLLKQISELGYGLDITVGADTSNVSLLFSLGIVEHARGDMKAARMWFDSTIVHHERGLRHRDIASAAKLRGYVNREEGNYAEAVRDFALAEQLYAGIYHSEEDKIEIQSVLAVSMVEAGADPAEVIGRSTWAYDQIVSNEDMRKRWTYGYLVYMHHARVLEALGRYREAMDVASAGLELCRVRGDQASIGYIQLKLAEVALAAGKYAEAKPPAQKALQIFSTTDHNGHLASAHECLERVYEHTPGGLRESLEHAREARRLRLEIAESSRLESIFALQSDHRRAQAEHKAELAEELAARTELQRARVASQRTALVLGIVCVVGLLGFVALRLQQRRRHNTTLEAEVAARTAELADQANMLAEQTVELEAKTRRLEASNQELERFAYIASHDLKTPLRNVTSFLGLIERRMPPDAKPIVGEYVEMAQEYAQSMHALVTNVLEFSRLNTNVADMSTLVDVRELCLGLAEQRRGDSTENPVQIDVLGLAELMAPELFLQQLIGNLIDNGLKYNKAEFPKITLKIHQTDDEVFVAVEDNGIGIAEEYHQQIFDLFKRLHTSDTYAGTGLGLASSRKIVDRLGGVITVRSVVGTGSVFTVRLPRRGAGEGECAAAVMEHDDLVAVQ